MSNLPRPTFSATFELELFAKLGDIHQSAPPFALLIATPLYRKPDIAEIVANMTDAGNEIQKLADRLENIPISNARGYVWFERENPRIEPFSKATEIAAKLRAVRARNVCVADVSTLCELAAQELDKLNAIAAAVNNEREAMK